MARQCLQSIRNYRKLRRELATLLRQALTEAPWETPSTPRRRKPDHS
jgi:hypothetical protein